MKILNCHVEGFGGIVDKDFSFDRNLSSFIFENGYGKTTLAAFIKAMLYGLDSYKKNSKGFEDRLHYAPFSGARFGGNITISFRGAEYKIERFFDVKSQTKDTVRVYKNGMENFDFGDEVGEAVFGFDKESFERLLFIKPDNDDCGATPGIKAKLNRFVSEGGDFSLADGLLDSAKKRLKAARGNSGLISKERENRANLLAEIENLEKLSLALDLIYEEKRLEILKIERLEAALKEKNELELKKQIYKGYSALKDSQRELENKIFTLEKTYPCGIPSDDEISELNEAIKKRDAFLVAQEASSLSHESEERLNFLRKKLGDTLPDDEQTKNAYNLLKRRVQINYSLQNFSYDEDTVDQKILPSKEEILPYKAMLSEHKRLSDESEALIDADSKCKSRGIKKLPFFFGIAFALLSIPLIFVHAALLAISIGIGISFILFSFLASNNDSSVTIRIAQMKAQSKQNEERIKIFLSKYGFYSENGVFFDFSKLEEAIHNKESSARRLEVSSREKESLIKEKESIERILKDFLSKHGFCGTNLDSEFSSLKDTIAEYTLLRSEKMRSDEKNLANKDSIARCREIIKAFSQKYLIPESELTAQLAAIILSDSNSHKQLLIDLKNAKTKVLSYKQENVISDELQSFDSVDYSGAEEELLRSRQCLVRLEHSINETEDKLSTLTEKQNELESCEGRIANYENKYRLLTMTQDLLKTADDNLTERYVGPVKKLFLEYLRDLSDTLGKRFSMDIDFNLRFEENGELRDERHLSEGQRSLTSLCLKLALLRAAFDGDEPFVIMDDPFVNLDEIHIKNSSDFIKKISKTTQIIYFSCHNSRKI